MRMNCYGNLEHGLSLCVSCPPTLGLSDLICKAGVRAAVTWTYEDA